LFNKIDGNYEFQDYEPDDFFFNKKILANSKGVFKLDKSSLGTLDNPINIGIRFKTEGLDRYVRENSIY
jgi:hypothetical protein